MIDVEVFGLLLYVVFFELEKVGNVGNVVCICLVLGVELYFICFFGFYLYDCEFCCVVMDYFQGVILYEYVGWSDFQV